MDRFHKLRIALRYWLTGRAHVDERYVMALEALHFAEKLTTGTRKDGKTPAFQHQLEIAHFLRTICQDHPKAPDIMAVAMLHDVPEDFDVGFEELEKRFSADIARSVNVLTKKHRGTKRDPVAYFDGISYDNIASLVKGADRIHNLQSMVGVFTREKQAAYCDEVRQHFLPMLKKARRNFPADEARYENIKHVLRSQLELLEAALAATPA